MNYVTSRISCISSSKSSLPIPTHTLSNTHTISIPVPYPYPYPWPYPTHTLPYPYPSIPYPIPYQIIICYLYVGRKDFFFYNNKTLGFFLITKNYLLTLKEYFLNFNSDVLRRIIFLESNHSLSNLKKKKRERGGCCCCQWL